MENKAIFNGLLMGGAAALTTLVLYFISPKMMLTQGSWLIYIIFIGFMAKAAIDERKDQGGFISFGDALKATFLAYVIGGLIHTLFNYIMTTVIDPSLMELTKEIAIESIEKLESVLGSDGIDEALDQLEDQSFKPSIGQTLMGYLVTLIVGFIFALIIAAIVKREDRGQYV